MEQKPGLSSKCEAARVDGRKFSMTEAQVRLAQVAMKERDTSVANLIIN